jgi:hypothetical protein
MKNLALTIISKTHSLMKHLFLVIIAAFLYHKNTLSQVLTDFENSNISGWIVEGDGSSELNITNGNPGNCLQVNEPATGALNFLLLPIRYLGDWSVATSSDSIYYDYYCIRLAGSINPTNAFTAEIAGPGGRMRYGINQPAPPFNVWNRKSIPVDTTKWQLVSGNFSEILADVRTIKVLAEFVNGNEIVRFDNVGITFSPVRPINTLSECSLFNAGEAFDGWSFQGTNGVTNVANEGNPPNCIRIADRGGIMSYALAPPKFLGNWGQEGVVIKYDVRVNTNISAMAPPPYMVKISGPGGVAFVPAITAHIDSAKNKWFTFEFPVDSNVFVVESGSLDSILALVEEVNVALEYYDGTAETVFFDNFCIDIASGIKPKHSSKPIQIWPNPATHTVHLSVPVDAVTLFDVHSKKVYEASGNVQMLELQGIKPGFYFLIVKHWNTIQYQRLVLRSAN